MRLLRDPGEVAVIAAMATSLLEVRREAAIPLSELDGVVVRETILAVLLANDDRRELLGALGAIAWIAPSGGFPAPPEARARVGELRESADETIRVLARDALAALASH